MLALQDIDTAIQALLRAIADRDGQGLDSEFLKQVLADLDRYALSLRAAEKGK